MIVADQKEIAAFLADPANWQRGVQRVERIETHGSMVFLGGDLALKMKRAVKLDYMDFSTLERRRRFCEAELRLNRRTAPGLYRRVLPVTRGETGALALDGAGEPVEWLLEMARFDQDTLFDRLAGRGELTPPLVERLADAIAAFHAAAEPCPDGGGSAAMAAVIEANRQDFEGPYAAVLDQASVAAVIAGQQARLAATAALQDRRRRQGAVRRCHGDLHLRNICLVEGRPTLFDCIEFNDDFAVIDVLYDLAFLVMDLMHRRLPLLANLVLNRYLAHGGDLAGLALMPLFLSVRAAVRAKVSATMAATVTDPAAIAALRDEARQYLALAATCLAVRPPRLVAIGGLSGSGKTTLARALAPGFGSAPGALVLRSDEIRKCLLGLPPTETLPEAAYSSDIGAKTYAEIAARAAAGLAAGQAVIADAVYARAAERTAIEAVARLAGVRFDGIWLEAPQPVLAGRIDARRDDASDATASVLARQVAYDLGEIAWRRLPAAAGPDAVAAAARAGLAAA